VRTIYIWIIHGENAVLVTSVDRVPYASRVEFWGMFPLTDARKLEDIQRTARGLCRGLGYALKMDADFTTEATLRGRLSAGEVLHDFAGAARRHAALHENPQHWMHRARHHMTELSWTRTGHAKHWGRIILDLSMWADAHGIDFKSALWEALLDMVDRGKDPGATEPIARTEATP